MARLQGLLRVDEPFLGPHGDLWGRSERCPKALFASVYEHQVSRLAREFRG